MYPRRLFNIDCHECHATHAAFDEAFCEAFAPEPSPPLFTVAEPFLMLECLGREMNASPQWEGFLARPSLRDAQKIGLDDSFGNAQSGLTG